MASPIFPGVGTQSRIAAVQQAGSDFNLRQEALNRQSGQALLGTALSGGLDIGRLVTEQLLARDLAEKRAQTARETGPLAVEQFRQENLEDRLRIQRESAGLEATQAQEFARDPITFIEDQVNSLLQTVQIMTQQGREPAAQAAIDQQLPAWLDLFEQLLRDKPGLVGQSPTLELLVQRRRAEDFTPLGPPQAELGIPETPRERRTKLESRGLAPAGNLDAGLQPVANFLLGASMTGSRRPGVPESPFVGPPALDPTQDPNFVGPPALDQSLQDAAERAARRRLLEQILPGLPGIQGNLGGRRGF